MAAFLKGTGSWLYSQLLVRLLYPTQSFQGLTVLVTGGNSGLGFEVAKHFMRLDAAKVIIAVRSLERGRAAAKAITEATGRPDVVEVWELDLARYSSVVDFAARVDAKLERLDVVVENAGVSTHSFQRAEDNEMIVTVNFTSTMLLGLLLLPKLRQTSQKYNKEVVLTSVGSFLFVPARFPEKDSDDIFRDLANERLANMNDRYYSVKLMLLLAIRQLAAQMSNSDKSGNITTSLINPGSVKTKMGRNNGLVFDIVRKLIFRDGEVGSRTLVHGAGGGSQTHGQYLSDCKICESSVFVRSDAGQQLQRKVWEQMMIKLEGIYLGISENL